MCVCRFFFSICEVLRQVSNKENKWNRFRVKSFFSTKTDFCTTHFLLFLLSSLRFNWNLFSARLNSIAAKKLKNWNIFSAPFSLCRFFCAAKEKKFTSIVRRERQVVNLLVAPVFVRSDERLGTLRIEDWSSLLRGKLRRVKCFSLLHLMRLIWSVIWIW